MTLLLLGVCAAVFFVLAIHPARIRQIVGHCRRTSVAAASAPECHPHRTPEAAPLLRQTLSFSTVRSRRRSVDRTSGAELAPAGDGGRLVPEGANGAGTISGPT